MGIGIVNYFFFLIIILLIITYILPSNSNGRFRGGKIVRGHYRRTKSGKITYVRRHTRRR